MHYERLSPFSFFLNVHIPRIGNSWLSSHHKKLKPFWNYITFLFRWNFILFRWQLSPREKPRKCISGRTKHSSVFVVKNKFFVRRRSLLARSIDFLNFIFFSTLKNKNDFVQRLLLKKKQVCYFQRTILFLNRWLTWAGTISSQSRLHFSY